MNKVEESILNSIKKNGYPEKKVNLPFQAIFNACKKNDVKLSDVLNSLKEQGVMSDIGNEKILFYSDVKASDSDQGFDFTDSTMFKAAMEKMKGMDPNELDALKQKVMDMSPEERADLMEQAKGFFNK
jgi:hypothetical protein